ncbi:hypothetical protein [Maioricimonas sp. JC845]|uniref:hypothetical protein n=1 Tax=Maioricimonas sp. JC845 TaxID=3232138 RepID=UPI00345A9692
MESSVRRSLRLMLAGLLLQTVAATAGATDLYQRGQVVSPDRPATSLWSCAVVGSVTTPAAYATNRADLTAADLVERAGGLTAESSGILRIVRNGAARIQIPLSTARNERLQPGDVVIAEYNRESAARLAQPASGLSPVCVIGLSNRPVVLPLRAENATLGSLLSLLRQSPEIAPSVRAIRPLGSPAPIADGLTAGTVLIFDTRLLNWQALATVDAFPPPIPISDRQVPQPTPVASAPSLDEQRTPMMLAPTGMVDAMSSEGPTRYVRDAAETAPSQSATAALPATTPGQFPEPGLVPPTPLDNGAPAAVSPLPSARTPDQSLTVPAVSTPTVAVVDTPAATGTEAEPALSGRPAAPSDAELAASSDTLAELGDVAADLPEAESDSRGTGNIWLLLLGMAIAIGTCLAGAFAWFRWEQGRTEPTLPGDELAEQERTSPEPPADRDTLLASLIENRIPLIEEETVVRAMSPVQGTVTGRRHLIVEEAHTELRGPHMPVAAVVESAPEPAPKMPLKVLQTDSGLHRVEGSDELEGPTMRSVERTTTPQICDDVVLPDVAETRRTASEHTEDLLERALLAMERERRK